MIEALSPHTSGPRSFIGHKSGQIYSLCNSSLQIFRSACSLNLCCRPPAISTFDDNGQFHFLVFTFLLIRAHCVCVGVVCGWVGVWDTGCMFVLCMAAIVRNGWRCKFHIFVEVSAASSPAHIIYGIILWTWRHKRLTLCQVSVLLRDIRTTTSSTGFQFCLRRQNSEKGYFFSSNVEVSERDFGWC